MSAWWAGHAYNSSSGNVEMGGSWELAGWPGWLDQ